MPSSALVVASLSTSVFNHHCWCPISPDHSQLWRSGQVLHHSAASFGSSKLFRLTECCSSFITSALSLPPSGPPHYLLLRLLLSPPPLPPDQASAPASAAATSSTPSLRPFFLSSFSQWPVHISALPSSSTPTRLHPKHPVTPPTRLQPSRPPSFFTKHNPSRCPVSMKVKSSAQQDIRYD